MASVASIAIIFVLPDTVRGQPPLTAAQLTQIAQSFFAAYGQALQNASEVGAVESLLTDNVEMTFAGLAGQVIPYAGLFIGHQGVQNALTFISNTSSTDSFEVKEILPTAYAFDFTKGTTPDKFLIPESGRVAVILKEESTVLRTGLQYHLEMVCLLTIDGSGQISNVHFFYDSYVPSQAYINDRHLIVNPDIDTVLDPLRNPNADPTTSLNAVLAFFNVFAQVAPDGNFDDPSFAATITEDCLIKFSGDPKFLPFADNVIRQGTNEVVASFKQQFQNSLPRVVNLVESFLGTGTTNAAISPQLSPGDRVVTTTLEDRTSTHTNRGYEVTVAIPMTARNGVNSAGNSGTFVGSIEGIFDSVITVTAFTGVDPFLSILNHHKHSHGNND
jgi:hypothetical protein